MESCFYGYPKPAFLGRSQNMLRTVTSVERYRRYDYRRDKIVEINRYHVLIYCLVQQEGNVHRDARDMQNRSAGEIQ